MALGTKRPHFAGFTTEHRPRPGPRPAFAEALQTLALGTVRDKGTVRKADYLRYLEPAEEWAAEPSWAQQPAGMEYALFDQQ